MADDRAAAEETARIEHPTPMHPELGDPEAEAIARPTLLRQLVPFVVAGGILYWVFHDIDFADVGAKIAAADLPLYLLGSLVFLTGFTVADVFSFGTAYHWFNARLPVRERFVVRAGAFPFQVVLPPLTMVIVLSYMWRRHQASPLRIVGSHLFVGVSDIANLGFALLVTLALVGGDAGLSSIWWLAAFGLLGAVGAHFAYWFTGLRDRFPFWRNPKLAGLFDSIQRAEARQYLQIFLTRSLFVIGNVAGGLITLQAFGIDAPLSYSAMALTMILVGAFLPISVASFGGPQAAAEFFFHPYATQETIAAYSIMWSLAFLLGRLCFGLIFFGTLWRGAFSARPVPSYDI